MRQEEHDVVVVGAGLAGLSAAVTAARAGRSVVLVEPHEQGGRAQVDVRNGFTFNRGPRALYLAGAGSRVLRDLGVDTSRGGTPPVHGGRGRRGGRLHLLPSGPGSLLRTDLLDARGKVQAGRLLGGLPRLDATALTGQTLDVWLAGTGVRDDVADLVRMMTRVATYIDAPDRIDASAAVFQVQLALGEGVRYLDGGFGSLVGGLLDRARSAGVACREAAATAVDGTAVVLATGERVSARTVVVAAGGPDAAARLLGRPVSTHPFVAATAACLELGVRTPPAHRFVLGVDEPLYLSTHCPPADLAPDGMAVVHVMRYQHPGDVMPAPEQRSLLRGLAADAGIAAADVVEERFLAQMVVTHAIPDAACGGFVGRPPVAADDRPGVFLAGDWVGDEGMLADAALASGARAGRLAAAASGRVAA